MNLTKKLLPIVVAGGVALFSSSCSQPLNSMNSNHRPKVSEIPDLVINEKEKGTYQIQASDEDGDKLNYSFDNAPSWLSVDSNGLMTWNYPRVKKEKKFTITNRVSDGSDRFSQDFNIIVKEVFDYFVSPGESIQEVINSVPEGSKILVRSGLYNQNLNLNKRIYLIGEDGTYLNPLGDLPVVTISASGNSRDDPVFLRNFNIHTAGTGSDPGKKTGIWIVSANPLSHIGLEGLVITGNNIQYETSGLESGLSISQDVSVDDLVIENSLFRDLSYGIISGAITSANPGYLRNLAMTDVILENNSSKGFYTERLSDANFTRVTAKNNGNPALSASWADDWNAGVDINLKYGNYQNINFIDFSGIGNGIGSLNGAALTIKARGTGSDSSYSAVPATLRNVLIKGGTFSGNNAYDIRFGEVGKGNTSPTEITLDGVNVTISNELSGVTLILK